MSHLDRTLADSEIENISSEIDAVFEPLNEEEKKKIQDHTEGYVAMGMPIQKAVNWLKECADEAGSIL